MKPTLDMLRRATGAMCKARCGNDRCAYPGEKCPLALSCTGLARKSLEAALK